MNSAILKNSLQPLRRAHPNGQTSPASRSQMLREPLAETPASNAPTADGLLQAQQALSQCPHLDDGGDETNITVTLEQATIVLRGHVGSFFQKQMAQEALLQTAGIRQVRNLLSVMPNDAKSVLTGPCAVRPY